MTEAKGLINGYDCPECYQVVWTVNKDAGTTPMFLACRGTEGCNGRSVSRMYLRIPGSAIPAFEWYAPSKKEIRKANEGAKHHYSMGGLALRAVQA